MTCMWRLVDVRQLLPTSASLADGSERSTISSTASFVHERSTVSSTGSLDHERSTVSRTRSVDDDPQAASGMVLPFDPLALSFHDLNYYVPVPSVRSYTSHTSGTCLLPTSLDVAMRSGTHLKQLQVTVHDAVLRLMRNATGYGERPGVSGAHRRV